MPSCDSFWRYARVRSLGSARSGRRTTSLQNSSKHVPRSQDYSGNTIPRLIDLSIEAYDAGIVHQAPPGAGVSDVMTLGKIFGILIFSNLAATGATLAGGISKNLATNSKNLANRWWWSTTSGQKLRSSWGLTSACIVR